MTLSERIVKEPPFEVSAKAEATLTKQVEGGLRQAIDSGYYQDGDFIPGYIKLANILGVSTAITRRAIALLVRDGLCQPRRGVGIRVCSGAGRAKSGNILVISKGDSGAYRYYISMVLEQMRHTLHAQNVMLSRAVVPEFNGRADYTELRSALNQHVSLAVLFDPTKGIESIVAKAGVPFILMPPAPPSRRAAGYISADARLMADSVREHCRACGVKRVLRVSMGKEGYHMQGFDISLDDVYETRELFIRPPDEELTTERLVQETIAVFNKAAQKGRLVFPDGYRPDMIVFQDDYIAQGALLALTASGIRVPEDIQVITLSNKGLGPVWIKPLTRIEVDGAAEGEAIAQLALDCLRNRRPYDRNRLTQTTFIPGATTMPKR